MSDMHERLRQARLKAGFKSARSAAIAGGWTVSTYAAHENGQNKYSADEAIQYAKKYKTSASWLLTGEEISTNFISKERQDDMYIIDKSKAVIAISQMLMITAKRQHLLDIETAEDAAELILEVAVAEPEDTSETRTPDMIRNEVAGIARTLFRQ